MDGYGIQIRSVSCIVEGNQINHSGVAGIYYVPLVSNMGGDRRCYIKILNNTIDYPTGKGIYVLISYDIIYRDIEIKSNGIYHNDGGTGIELRVNVGTVYGFDISNNRIMDTEGAGYTCITVQAPVDDDIALGTIIGNVCYRLDDLDNTIELIGNATHKIQKISVLGNVIQNGAVGLYGSNADLISVYGNVIYGTSVSDMSAFTAGNLGGNSLGGSAAAHVTDVHNI